MRKIWKVTITGNYLVVNQGLGKYFWISKDQSSCHQLSQVEKDKFFREYDLEEADAELELKEKIKKVIERIENTQEPDKMLGKIEDMQQVINIAS